MFFLFENFFFHGNIYIYISWNSSLQETSSWGIVIFFFFNLGNFFIKKYIYFFRELVSWRDEFLLKFLWNLKRWFWFKKKLSVHPLSYLLSPRWQKLPYICNNFLYYNNLSITFLNYRTIEKSPKLLGSPYTATFACPIPFILVSYMS